MDGARPEGRIGVAARVLAPARIAWLRWRWRKRRKEGRSIRVGVSDPAAFLSALDRRGVRCAVMRWWDEVPAPPFAEPPRGDVDVLVDDDGARAASVEAALRPGPCKVEFRSVTGEFGSLAGWPYLPPAFADEVLSRRVAHPRGFPVPAPEDRLPLVMFHLCYHKAEASGIPVGDGSPPPATPPKSDYAAKLRALAAAEGEALPEPLTLRSVQEELVRRGWDMQLDLLARWPLRTPWIETLLAEAKRVREREAAAMPRVTVFLLREDIPASWREAAAGMIARDFDVIEQGALDAAQRARCLRHLRGGNWFDRRGRAMAGPFAYAVCAVRDGTGDDRRRTALLLGTKRALRREIEEKLRAEGVRVRHVLHGADDPFEAQHMIDVIFGADADAARKRFGAAAEVPRRRR
ncbi:MAG: hypothetical protein HMLKMBBP_00335 [Planctomycetes bacterium]|nr:hypothetical protein [Planctomycetota bacterium]